MPSDTIQISELGLTNRSARRAKLREIFQAGLSDENLPRKERRRMARQLARVHYRRESPHTNREGLIGALGDAMDQQTLVDIKTRLGPESP